MANDDDFDTFNDLLVTTKSSVTQNARLSLPQGDSDVEDFFAATGIQASLDANDHSKPWMKFHQFHLVKNVAEVATIVDQAIAHGRCGLDLETEGFDNRIEYDSEGKPYTVHKIVGYCVAIRGVGYYIPVRHRFDPTYGEKDPNVDPVGVELEIKRLCIASQPVLTEEGLLEDPLGSSKIVTPPQVVIYFWHSKFDQEFLYPITGIDWWHHSSFEDGMLAAYVVYTDDNNLGLKAKANANLSIQEPELKNPDGSAIWHRYEMIKFTDLFSNGVKRSDMRFYFLYPEEGTAVVKYGCSDAICTELLCEPDPSATIFEGTPKYKYHNVLAEALQKHGPTYRLEKQVVQAVRTIERTRAKIDKTEILLLLEEAQKELVKFETLIKDLATSKGFPDFNPGSTVQLSEFLFGSRGLDITPKPAKNEDSGQFKTDAATLEAMAESNEAPEILTWIVKYRQIDKIISTYLLSIAANCDVNDKLRFNFKQTGAATGRFTAPSGEADHGYSGIPIQGIPGKVDPKRPKVASSLRRIFVSSEGYTLVKIDYAGQELRIVANLSGEPLWVDEFQKATAEGREADLHTLTAVAFYPGLKKTDPDFKNKRGNGKCVHPSTLIWTDKGLKSIRELGPYGEEDQFTTGSGSVYTGAEYKSVASLYNGGVKELIHVVTQRGILTCTPLHKLLLRDGQFMEAGMLKKGMLLASVSLPALTIASRTEVQAAAFRCGTDEYDLRVPNWVVEGGAECVLSYLGGLFAEEATISRNLLVQWATTDLVFAGQVAAVAAACGLQLTCEVVDRSVLLTFSVEASAALMAYMKQAPKAYRTGGLEHAHNVAVVSGVLPAGEGPCLDLSIDSSEHVYVANGFITHNTANFALIYGGGTAAVQRATKCDKIEAARRKAAFDKSVPVFASWVKRQHSLVKKNKGITNAFGRFIAIPDATIKVGDVLNGKTVEEQDARKIQAACERKATNFPVQSTGADVLKIALVKLNKELFKKGWLRNGGDDSVRMIMTVHDEIVFEVRHDRLQEAMPILIELMESPSKMGRWKIPLVAEALIGLSWDAKYDWGQIVKGLIPVPEWLQGHVIIAGGSTAPPTEDSALPPAAPPPSSVIEVPKAASPAPVLETTAATNTVSLKFPDKDSIATFAVIGWSLRWQTVKSVLLACTSANFAAEETKEFKILRLVTTDGAVIIDSNLGIRIDPDTFGQELLERNLSYKALID